MLFFWLGWQSCQPIDLFDAPVEIVVKKESVEIKRTLVNVSTFVNGLIFAIFHALAQLGSPAMQCIAAVVGWRFGGRKYSIRGLESLSGGQS